MNICIVNDGFNMGGVERVSIKLANSIQSSTENSITLLDFSGKNRFFYKVNSDVNTPKIIKPRNIKRKVIRKLFQYKHKIDNKNVNIQHFYKEQILDLISFLKMEKQEVLILCQGMLTAIIPIIKKEIPNLKIIAWQHNDFEIYVKQYYKEFQLDYLLGLQQADQVVCLTNKDLKNYIKINKNSCNIYNPLTIESKRISELENKIIVFVGRLVIEQKGLDYLISIAKNINNEWKIVVAGDGADKDNFNNMIRDNNLEKKVVLTGSLKSNELNDLYVKGSIFVSTSRWEGFGLVITEAMACGLPIVSFNNFGPSEILENGKYGMLVDNYNVDEFIYKLNELINSKEKRKEMQLKSIERVKSFKMEYILNQWMEVISRINQKS